MSGSTAEWLRLTKTNRNTQIINWVVMAVLLLSAAYYAWCLVFATTSTTVIERMVLAFSTVCIIRAVVVCYKDEIERKEFWTRLSNLESEKNDSTPDA